MYYNNHGLCFLQFYAMCKNTSYKLKKTLCFDNDDAN